MVPSGVGVVSGEGWGSLEEGWMDRMADIRIVYRIRKITHEKYPTETKYDDEFVQNTKKEMHKETYRHPSKHPSPSPLSSISLLHLILEPEHRPAL